METAPATLSEFIEAIDEIAQNKTYANFMRLIGADHFDASLAGSYARSLERVFMAVQAAYPACSTKLPSGKFWAGTTLPGGWADAQVLVPESSSDKPQKRASLLHLASMLGARPKWIGWLLASGVDPLRFCPALGNAPLGQMAYSGDHGSIRVLRRAGFDLSLRLDPSHVDMSQPAQARLAGTTLLHRVVNRGRFQEERARKVVHELLLGGLSPLEPTISGETPLDLCRDQAMRDHLERHVAKKSKRSLDATVQPAKSPPTPRRKRF